LVGGPPTRGTGGLFGEDSCFGNFQKLRFPLPPPTSPPTRGLSRRFSRPAFSRRPVEALPEEVFPEIDLRALVDPLSRRLSPRRHGLLPTVAILPARSNLSSLVNSLFSPPRPSPPAGRPLRLTPLLRNTAVQQVHSPAFHRVSLLRASRLFFWVSPSTSFASVFPSGPAGRRFPRSSTYSPGMSFALVPPQ